MMDTGGYGLLAVVHLILWIIAMVSIITGGGSPAHKVLWGCVVFFFPCIGLIIYYLIGRTPGTV